MKNSLIALSILFLFSCGKRSETQTDFSNITFHMDTVMVDPGEELLFLKWGLDLSALSEDKIFLYNFNLDDHTIEKINVDKLVLEEKLTFEKEGPNGTGENLYSLNLCKNNHIFLRGYDNVGLYTMTGEKIKNYQMQNRHFEGDSLKTGEDFHRLILDNEEKYLYGLIGSHSENTFTLGKLDYKSKVLKKFRLESFDKLADYRFIFQSMMIMMPSMDIVETDGRLILSNAVTSELCWYDMSKDSLFHKSFESKLTANEKKGKYRKEFDSYEEFEKEQKLMHQEINFMAPFFDEVNQRFYRFSYEELDKEVDRDSGEKAKAKVYLTILDKDFNMLGESPVPTLSSSPAKHFAKDGKIWIFENIGDEMAFVRISFLP